MVAVLKLFLFFISRVWWDNAACSWSLEPQFTCDPTSFAPTSLEWFLVHLLLLPYPATTATLGPRGAFGKDTGKVRVRLVCARGLSFSVIKCKSVCLTHSETKQYQNVRVWSRERFIAEPCKETGGSCLKKKKKNQLPESLKQSPLIGKGREGRG